MGKCKKCEELEAELEKKPALTIYCKKCGGNKFHVGEGNYWTGIKCVTCGWEKCVHEG